MSEDNPFIDEGGAAPAGTSASQTQPGPLLLPTGAEAVLPDANSDTTAQPPANEPETDDETDEAAGTETPTPSAPPDSKPAMKVKTKIEFDVTAEPYVPGQRTIILALAIRPDDGHPDGRLVVLGARSHDEAPILATARLNTLQLPEPLAQFLAEYEGQLPRRGAAKAETQARKDAEKKAAEERRQASRKGAATAKAKHATAAKAETKPATVKPASKPPSSQVSLFGA
jgi:hypothetical protein